MTLLVPFKVNYKLLDSLQSLFFFLLCKTGARKDGKFLLPIRLCLRVK